MLCGAAPWSAGALGWEEGQGASLNGQHVRGQAPVLRNSWGQAARARER